MYLSTQQVVYSLFKVFQFPFLDDDHSLLPPSGLESYFLSCRFRMYKLAGHQRSSLWSVQVQLLGQCNSQPSLPPGVAVLNVYLVCQSVFGFFLHHALIEKKNGWHHCYHTVSGLVGFPLYCIASRGLILSAEQPIRVIFPTYRSCQFYTLNWPKSWTD